MQIRNHVGTSNPALILHPTGTALAFDELERRANRLAHYLREAGLREGDTVAVLMENNEHIHAAMWGARRIGLHYVPVNTHLTIDEVAYIVSNSGARAVIGSRALAPLCAGLSDRLCRIPLHLRLIADFDLPGWATYPDCVAAQPSTPVADEREGDLLQYSSGTTGKPKGIRRPLLGCLPSDAPVMLAPLFARVGITAESVYLSPAPLYHTAPSMWSMSVQAVGATAVVLEQFDAEEALACIERYRVTHAQFVPAMFVRMIKLPKSTRRRYDLSSLQRVVVAAAPCPAEIKREMLEWWGPIIDEYYSSSEGSGVTYITAEEWIERPGSVGRPLVGIPHIVDESGLEVAHGNVGDVYFEGGLLFDYLGDPAKTAESRNAKGWSTVGDVGYLDGDGYLFLTDRRHHVIISGGVNIYPREIEDVLVSHPRVADAAVFGVPDPSMGQSVMAVVQTVDLLDAHDDFAADLAAWMRDRLAHYKCPRTVAFERHLPRTDAGKLYKQSLVEKYG
ncbi:acyl-CoA synthetase [Mycolicibacterium sp. (ex Dasyatis americana)]|nr:acyl-CoA synthetase [Mycolicibacterium sp. (ex Dasyatis americana)]